MQPSPALRTRSPNGLAAPRLLEPLSGPTLRLASLRARSTCARGALRVRLPAGRRQLLSIVKGKTEPPRVYELEALQATIASRSTLVTFAKRPSHRRGMH